MSPEAVRRLTVKIPTEDFLTLENKIPWGLKIKVMQLICHDLALMLHDPDKRESILRAALGKSLGLAAPCSLFTLKEEVSEDEPR